MREFSVGQTVMTVDNKEAMVLEVLSSDRYLVESFTNDSESDLFETQEEIYQGHELVENIELENF